MNNIIRDSNKLLELRRGLKQRGKSLVFTNGCFDILHVGHVDYLAKAKSFGDALLVALNTDDSVRRIKGDKRPIVNQEERAFVVANLKSVDYVTFFDEDTPGELIDSLVPDVLVKGADWKPENIVGRETVERNGGRVERITFISDRSTSDIIGKILKIHGKE